MHPVEGVLIVTAILLLFVQLNLQQFVVFPCWTNDRQTNVWRFTNDHDQRKKSTSPKNSCVWTLSPGSWEFVCEQWGKKSHLRSWLKTRSRIELPVRIVFHVTLTSVDSWRCDSHCLARLFENLPAPPKHYGVFDVLPIRKVFAKGKNLGSH